MAMKRFLFLVFACLLLGVAFVYAQEEPALDNLEIAIWPEYDRPEVLVIQRGLLAADTSLPAAMEIRIPASAGQPSAVAYVDETGQRLNQQYTTREEGDWLVVSFDLASLGFQLEYYDPLVAESSGQREFTYSYVADYPVAELTVEFQVPLTAQDFALEPEADSVATESDGLVYHSVAAGSLEQGEQRDWTMTYQKDDDTLTVSAFAQPEAPAPTASPAVGSDDNSVVWIFLVAFVALVAVGGGAFWLGRRTQEPAEAPVASTRHKRRGSGRGGGSQSQSSRSPALQASLYCHQCGAELRPDSDFCHRCGTQVR
jgi:hypothetical protein